jgi:hypothetical protein
LNFSRETAGDEDGFQIGTFYHVGGPFVASSKMSGAKIEWESFPFYLNRENLCQSCKKKS